MDLWPSDPIASSEVLNHPGLFQCLALADAKQCDSLVQSCLSQLIKPGSVIDAPIITSDTGDLLPYCPDPNPR